MIHAVHDIRKLLSLFYSSSLLLLRSGGYYGPLYPGISKFHSFCEVGYPLHIKGIEACPRTLQKLHR